MTQSLTRPVTPEIELQRVDDVPRDSRVCHYDELESPAKERLSALVERDSSSVGEDVLAGFHCCEIVKFTDYYELSVDRPDAIR